MFLREFEKIESEVLMEKLRSKGQFNFQQWKNLPFVDQLRQLEQQFQVLGEGSSRKVFLLSNRFVMKFATNSKGIAQNKTEVQFAQDKTLQPALALIQNSDPKGNWVMAQLVRPLTSWNEFEKIKGYSSEIIGYAMGDQWEPSDIDQSKMSTPEQKVKAKQDLIFLNAINSLVKKGLIRGDMKFHDHWGKTPDGRVVLLDYGFDRNTANTEYAKDGKSIGSNSATRKPVKTKTSAQTPGNQAPTVAPPKKQAQ